MTSTLAVSFSRRLKPNYIAFPILPAIACLFEAQPPTKPIISGSFLSCLLFLANGSEPLGEAKAIVGMARFNEHLGMLEINIHSFRLSVRRVGASKVRSFIPLHTQPRKSLEDFFLRAWHIAFSICVLDSENKLSFSLACKQVVIQSSSCASDVKATCRGGGKTDAGRCFHGIGI
jgi:hypothetical protein